MQVASRPLTCPFFSFNLRRASQLLRLRLSEGRACRPQTVVRLAMEPISTRSGVGGDCGRSQNGAHHAAWGQGERRAAERRGLQPPQCVFVTFWPRGAPKTAMIAYETCAGVHALSVFYVTLHAVKRHKDVSFYHLQPQRRMFCPLLPASLCRNHGASTAHGQPFAAAHPHISTHIPCPCNTFAISAS